MPREITIQQFVGKMTRAIATTEAAQKRSLERAAKVIQKTAKAKLGHYQKAVGEFEAWEALHESTLNGGRSPKTGFRFQGKIELGYASEGEDNPLMRTGALRDSIEIKVGDFEAAVGSDLVYAAAQELGDPDNDQPARSFLGASAAQHAEKVAKILGEGTVINLLGDRVLQIGHDEED